MKNFSDMLKEALESEDVERNFQEMLDMLDECYEYMVQNRGGSRMRGSQMMNEEDYHFDKKSLEMATSELENADDSQGAKWNLVQTNMLMRDNGLKANEKFNEYDFNYTMNMLYSDFSKLLGNDVMNYYKMAKCFLEDEDAPSGKAYRYYMAMHPDEFEEYEDYYDDYYEDDMIMYDDYDNYPRQSHGNYNSRDYDDYDYRGQYRNNYDSSFDRSSGSSSGRNRNSGNRSSRGGNRSNSRNSSSRGNSRSSSSSNRGRSGNRRGRNSR